MKAPVHLMLALLAIVLFFIAGLGGFFVGEPWPWHGRLIAWGLFCWALSEQVTI